MRKIFSKDYGDNYFTLGNVVNVYFKNNKYCHFTETCEWHYSIQLNKKELGILIERLEKIYEKMEK